MYVVINYLSYTCFVLKDTATTEIYTYCHTLSLHGALPIFLRANLRIAPGGLGQCVDRRGLGQRRRLDRLGLRQRRHGGLGEGGRGHRKGGEAGTTVGTGVAHELGSGIPLVTRGDRKSTRLNSSH